MFIPAAVDVELDTEESVIDTEESVIDPVVHKIAKRFFTENLVILHCGVSDT